MDDVFKAKWLKKLEDKKCIQLANAMRYLHKVDPKKYELSYDKRVLTLCFNSSTHRYTFTVSGKYDAHEFWTRWGPL